MEAVEAVKSKVSPAEYEALVKAVKQGEDIQFEYPKDWVGPAVYTSGTLKYHLEVMKKRYVGLDGEHKKAQMKTLRLVADLSQDALNARHDLKEFLGGTL